jgi:hypothetical protein
VNDTKWHRIEMHRSFELVFQSVPPCHGWFLTSVQGSYLTRSFVELAHPCISLYHKHAVFFSLVQSRDKTLSGHPTLTLPVWSGWQSLRVWPNLNSVKIYIY